MTKVVKVIITSESQVTRLVIDLAHESGGSKRKGWTRPRGMAMPRLMATTPIMRIEGRMTPTIRRKRRNRSGVGRDNITRKRRLGLMGEARFIIKKKTIELRWRKKFGLSSEGSN